MTPFSVFSVETDEVKLSVGHRWGTAQPQIMDTLLLWVHPNAESQPFAVREPMSVG